MKRTSIRRGIAGVVVGASLLGGLFLGVSPVSAHARGEASGEHDGGSSLALRDKCTGASGRLWDARWDHDHTVRDSDAGADQETVLAPGPSAPDPQPDAMPSSDEAAAGNSVERWRSLVEQYFRPEDVETALRVISLESSGNPDATNPTSGAAGLFQILPSHGVNGYDPETAVSWAASRVYEVRGSWSDWTAVLGSDILLS